MLYLERPGNYKPRTRVASSDHSTPYYGVCVRGPNTTVFNEGTWHWCKVIQPDHIYVVKGIINDMDDNYIFPKVQQ